MVRMADLPNAGFSEAKAWLPVKAPQAAQVVDVPKARNDNVLHSHREAPAFRTARDGLRLEETIAPLFSGAGSG